MGNNSSSHHHHAPGGVARAEMGPGWTHSFPRDMHRQHLQSSGHKVFPEPPNQRLRATNNGSIIHNGGTISGRKPSTFTLPHDLNKQAAYRTRSASASTFGQPRPQNGDPQYYHYQNGDPRDREITEFKRFGSEPDLRYSPSEQGRYERHHGYPDREAKERDSKYNKGKKKYKAPPPPANGDGSSPDSYNWSAPHDRELIRGHSEDIRPPPRKSRLFKTRAETKKAQANWTSLQDREMESKRWSDDQHGKENLVWRQQQERWDKDERRSKVFDGKNTLQRSLSSPEFQAELMQAARKVRSKMNYQREGPVGAATPTNHREFSTKNQKAFIDERRIEGKTSRYDEERFFDERRTENKNFRNQEVSYDHRQTEQPDQRYQRESSNDRQIERNSWHKIPKKSATYDDDGNSAQRIADKKLHMDRIEKRGQSFDDRLSDKQRIDHSEERRNGQQRHNDRSSNKTFEDFAGIEKRVESRTRSESPILRQYHLDKNNDRRSQGSGRESTPEPLKNKDFGNLELRNKMKTELRNSGYKNNENRRSEPIPKTDDKEPRSKEKLSRKQDVRNPPVKNWEILPPAGKSPPKTFYFGMDLTSSRDARDLMEHQMEQIQSRLNHVRELSSSPESSPGEMDDDKTLNTGDDIALKLRPTLPKKQLEIPRFSPSAAWRLLSALDTPNPTMSTASEEGPVLFEERIERLSRPPPPLVALGPRSSHDKSGDSGISGDAGGVNDDSLQDIVTDRAKASTRPTWTPQQDLGEESSSDAGVDSPPPMATPVKFPPRPHVFSLSLPRDDNRMSLYNPEFKNKESSSFNSLQKLKRSVSGAFGLGAIDIDRKQENDVLDGNWLLSTSAPNSLQHSQQLNGDGIGTPSPGWETNFVENEIEEKAEFPIIMKPPSFSYLASGGHVMYLPESNGPVYQTQSLNYRNNSNSDDKNSNNSNSKYKKSTKESKKASRYSNTDIQKHNSKESEFGLFRDRRFNDTGLKSRKYTNLSKSCENISEMKQRERSPSPGPENLQDAKDISSDLKVSTKRNSKNKRFTFQSTVRQIERRRLAEKLSREAEAKEQQRKGELEAMRKVEEEFQKKRAREKASIRQQLRLFNMDETTGSLPVVWDNTQLSRADPDGAPSSSASSPTSAPPSKLSATRKHSGSSDEYNRKAHLPLEYRHQQQEREYKDYRSRYYEFGPESAPHIDFKHTTVHPKVVYDIPKSAPVYVDAKIHQNKPVNLNSTPRSDNYRKDFAHGAVAARSSLASSDSELSQPNTRPHSRQTGNKMRVHRSRSASPTRSNEDVSSEEESPVEPITQERIIPSNNLILNTIQPFVRDKSYRPISYNPQSSAAIPS